QAAILRMIERRRHTRKQVVDARMPRPLAATRPLHQRHRLRIEDVPHAVRVEPVRIDALCGSGVCIHPQPWHVIWLSELPAACVERREYSCRRRHTWTIPSPQGRGGAWTARRSDQPRVHACGILASSLNVAESYRV